MMSVKQHKLRKKIGKYEIERQIGKGSAAHIYLAKQEFLGRKLVIKELLPLHTSNEKLISRFQREAKIISQFSHDVIVHVYDYWARNNRYYIAMEYVQGKTLKEILATVGYLPVPIASAIMYQICRGLRYAHAHGVIHRDMKPANIIISKIGQVKILDFGIAHFQHDEELTSLGSIIGTYNYMSPEQALGKRVCPASDIFSLGILFYEMLTGVKPFFKNEKGDVLEKIVNKRFKAPGKINPAVTRIHSKIIRKSLKKKPQRRLQSTEQIIRILEAYLKNYPLDHQETLMHFMSNLIPQTVDNHWPPSFWRRVWYRITHQSRRKYFIFFLSLFVVIFVEASWIKKGITLPKQWRWIKETSMSIWQPVEALFKQKPETQSENLEEPGTPPVESNSSQTNL